MPSIWFFFSFTVYKVWSYEGFITTCLTWFSVSGFEILAFPCNQFLKQEPGTSEAAQDFACTRFKAEYPIFQKVVFLVPLALCFWEAMPFNVAIRYSRFISCLPVIYFKHMGREQTRKKYRLENLATTKSVKSLLVMPSGGLSKRWRP